MVVSMSDAQTLLEQFSQQMADAVEQVGRSIVTVYGRRRQPSSGFAFAQNLVLTASHALERTRDLRIGTPDGRKLAAELVGRDDLTDLAVLRVGQLDVPTASQTAAARVGQMALAVARPGEDGLMASLGVVSKLLRSPAMSRARWAGRLDRVIQTDAIPYPGFSGGLLILPSGAVLGMLTSSLLPGIAAAIPLDVALPLAQDLAHHGYLKRGYLGVLTQQVVLPAAQRTESRQRGLLVVRVEDNSPAEQGGMMVGDVIVSVDERPVNDADDLLAAVSAASIGQPLRLGVLRGGVYSTVTVAVGER